jgi:hypothetical protein
MINLKKYKEELLNRTNVLKYVKEYDIYAYYLGPFIPFTIMKSPFRTDNKPSFGIFYGKYGDLAFNDYKLGGGDCIKFVSLMEHCDHKTALGIINNRYNLKFPNTFNSSITSKYTHKAIVSKTKILEKKEIWINVEIRDWQEHDKEYWFKAYEISGSTLTYYNVFPIKRYWINDYRFNADKHAYAYRFDKNVYKIYQPYNTHFKWATNVKNKDIYQGHEQLADSGNILFITSSLKDVMVLHEAGFSAIAPHTEHQILNDELFHYYSSKWNLMVILYDNDEAGILHANKMVKKYGIKSLILPESDTKDPSDFVKKYDLSTLQNWILTNI